MNKISKEMIESFLLLVACEAKNTKIIQIVNQYQIGILSEIEYINEFDGSRVLSPDNVYTLSEYQFTLYIESVRTENIKHGFVFADKDICPRLVAENEIAEAERAFFQSMHHLHGLDYVHDVNSYRKMIEIGKKAVAAFLVSR